MAFTKIIFKHPESGVVRAAPVGFSWTVLFFGFLPPLFREDWKWGAILFALGIFTFTLSNVVFGFTYNRLHIADLVAAGFKAQSVASGNLDAISARIGVAIPPLEAA